MIVGAVQCDPIGMLYQISAHADVGGLPDDSAHDVLLMQPPLPLVVQGAVIPPVVVPLQGQRVGSQHAISP